MKTLIVSLLAFCLLIPSVVDAHRANPVIAGLISPTIWMLSSYFIWPIPSLDLIGNLDNLDYLDNLYKIVTATPGFGHFYAGNVWAGCACTLGWYIGIWGFFEFKYSFVALPFAFLMYVAVLFDAIHAPFAAAKHNRKHAKEKTESSRLTIFPTLALGKEYAALGLAMSF